MAEMSGQEAFELLRKIKPEIRVGFRPVWFGPGPGTFGKGVYPVLSKTLSPKHSVKPELWDTN